MKDILSILSSLKSKGIAIDTDATGHNLRLTGPLGMLTDDDKDRLRTHRDDLLDFIRSGKERQRQSRLGKISPVPGLEKYPLSNAQRRLWVLSQFEEGNIAYNIPGTHVFEGILDQAALAFAFDRLLERHESLRTVFRQDEQGDVFQFILPPDATGFQIQYHDLRRSFAQQEQLPQLLKSACMQPFDLANGPLIRATVYQLEDHKWVFAYVLHHIVSDGWSMSILLRELLELYTAHTEARETILPPLPVQYRDYAVWQQQLLQGDALTADKNFWLQQFAGTLPVITLPIDKPRPTVKTYHGGLHRSTIPAADTAGLVSLCREQGATLFMGLLATLNVLLYRYTGQEDLIVGSPVAGRLQPELEDQIGLYLNTLAFRTACHPDQSFRTLLQQVQQVTLAAYEHQAYPFDELVNALPQRLEMSHSPLFDVLLVLQNHAAVESTGTAGLKVSSYEEMEHLISKFDLSFNFIEHGPDLQMAIEYNHDLFHESTIERLAAHFTQLLRAAAAQPDDTVAGLPLLTTAEKKMLLEDFNNTATDYPKDQSIAALFEAQAALTPDHIALVSGDTVLTYQLLNEAANRMARWLRAKHMVQPNELVAVALPRSEQLIIALLGILKAGAAYVPLDISYPPERIRYMITNSGSRVLLDEAMMALFTAGSATYSADNLLLPIPSEQLAYVMYTSGSTGKPKGVMMPHRGVVRLVKPGGFAGLTGRERLLTTGSVSFDAVSFEYWGMLLNGGTLIMCPQETMLEVESLAAAIAVNGVDTMWFTAGWLHQLIDEAPGIFNSLKTLLAGGDRLSPEHIAALRTACPSLKIINGYGPTENATFSLTYEIGAVNGDIPIGRPLENSTAYIIGPGEQLAPIGVTGEIYVGGDGLATGYRNDSTLTAQKFVQHPFIPGQRLYKTGDLGKWLPDGNIAFAGRKDDQLKIRGYRIEPGEIESALMAFADVEKAVVVPYNDNSGDKILLAYIVAATEIDQAALRNHLGHMLPAYMLPAHIMQLDQMPLTPNGKTDKKQLPLPEDLHSTAVAYIAPRNETESALAAIWEEILDRKTIGVKDHFFDLGGHSLKATRLLSRIYQAMEVKLSLKDVFLHPVLEQQANLIAGSRKTAYINITPAPQQEYYPLSSAQQRLFFLQELAPDSTGYNMPMVNYLGKTADRQRMLHALQQLTARHEGFRTSFEKKESGTVQRIHPEVEIVLEEKACSLSDFESVAQAFIRPFDLSRAPLLRSAIIHVKELGYVWLADLHHIISDGTSHQVLTDDFLQLYQGAELSPLPLQYKDFAVWQNERLQNGELADQQAFWLSKLEGPLPRLDFPADKPRPTAFTFEGSSHTFSLGPQVAAQLHALCRQEQGTLQMVLLAVLQVLLHKYTGQEDIIVGCPIAGRRHPALDRIAGMFVNTLGVRGTPDKNKSFRSFCREIIAECIAAYEHQDLPFEVLVDELHVERDPSRNPVFDVMLLVQNFSRSAADVSHFLDTTAAGNVSQLPWKGPDTSKFDMSWFVTEADGDIVIQLEYYAAVYLPGSMEQLCRHFSRVLDTVLGHPDIAISGIPLLSEAETATMLRDYVNGHTKIGIFSKPLHIIFEEQARLSPDRIAIEDNGTIVTYRELDEQSNRVAHFLRQNAGLQLEDRVGVLMSRSRSLLLSFVSILKAGGTYVPLDRNSPEERLMHMIADGGIETLLIEKSLVEYANRLQWRCKTLKHLVCLDSDDFYEGSGTRQNPLMEKDLWDQVGNTAIDDISGGGWLSSFTGEYISTAEMEEYSINVYTKLKDLLHPGLKVLEIGCSSGITMFRLAPEVGHYTGVDFSASILSRTQQVVEEKGLTNITLACMAAHELDQLPDNDYDLVIINSVIQSFHGHNYLRRVLQGAVRKMKNTGHIFLGDLLDEEKRDSMTEALAAFREANRDKGYHTKQALDLELFISRNFLHDLLQEEMGIAGITCSDKVYTISNELTEYRYDALLHIHQSHAPLAGARHKYQFDLRAVMAHSPLSPNVEVGLHNLAYIIYTSGSTGKPKGVMIEHKQVVSLFENSLHFFGPDDDVRAPLIASNVFDLSVYECFLPLLTGGRAVMPDEDRIKEIPWLAEMLKRVTAFHAVPVLMTQVANHIKSQGNAQEYAGVTHVFVGGEAVSSHLMQSMQEAFPNASIYVLYGPTESALFISHYLCPRKPVQLAAGAMIGIPNPNTRIYVVDEQLRLMPPGIAGELCVGGPQLARGYLNKPELTAEKFIADPYMPGERMYKTGDLVKWMPDGNLIYLSRIDTQVKVRGYRIETGEIENTLQHHPDIEESAVIARANKNGEMELAAYIVSATELNTSDLRTWLSKTLPVYMVPEHFVQLEKLPQTPNGKVDRKRLPAPEGMSMGTGIEYVAPANEKEETLVAIWQEILGDKKIGVKDNFFDLGGNSIKIVRMVERINQQFNIKIPVVTAFRFPTISALSARLSADTEEPVVLPDEKISDAVNIMDQTLQLLNHYADEK